MSFCQTKGWVQVALASNLTADVTPASAGARRLLLVRASRGIRAFDADCPHRGANLGLGGRVAGDSIVCPFHHYHIQLGCHAEGILAVREYAALTAGGMVFVRLSPEHDCGWPGYLESLLRDHYAINGFEMSIRAPAELVIENAFDRLHFQAVHGIQTGPFAVRSGASGELLVEGTFFVPRPGHRSEIAPASYRAVIVSPGVAMVQLVGPIPYTVITGATARAEGGCTVRLTLAVPRSYFPDGAPTAFYEPLLAHSRRGLEEDRVVWENLAGDKISLWQEDDEPSRQFYRFCEAFSDD